MKLNKVNKCEYWITIHNDLGRTPDALAKLHRVGHTAQRLVDIEAYHGIIPTDKLSLDSDTLIVCWRVDYSVKQSLKANQNGAKLFDVRNPSLTVGDLRFTGSEYKKVVIMIGEKIDIESKSCLILLYNSISRATGKVRVFCHEDSLDAMNSLMTHSDEDVASREEQPCQVTENLWDSINSKLEDMMHTSIQTQDDNFNGPSGVVAFHCESVMKNILIIFSQIAVSSCQHSNCQTCYASLAWKVVMEDYGEQLCEELGEWLGNSLPENFSEDEYLEMLVNYVLGKFQSDNFQDLVDGCKKALCEVIPSLMEPMFCTRY